MSRTAFVTALFAALAVGFCSGSARGAFPGTDGRIAFVSDRNGSPSIFTMDPNGSGVAKLVANNPQGGFTVASPNGKRLLFSVRIASKVTVSYELWTMNANGSHVRRFLTQASDSPFAATWSPNGKKIAYYRNGVLWVMNANRRGARELTNVDFSGAAPSWSKRGLIAFDRAGSIWTVNVKSGKETLVGPGSQPSWSPDGSRLLYVAVPRGASMNDIFAMRANGSGSKQLTSTPNASETQPAWSPGGPWIAFTGQDGVYVMRSNGSSVRLVAVNGLQPSWTTGTSGVIYTRRTARWNGFVMRTDLNGKHTRWLLHPRVDASPAWSPDGTQLAFTRDGAVNLVDAAGDVLRSTGLRGADPAWSPDGQHLVVASGLDLVIANSDGTSPAPLDLKFDPAKYARLSEPDWSAPKKSGMSSIAFVATDSEGLQSIFVLNLVAKTLKRVGTLDQLQLGCGTIGASSPSWAPDGSLVAFACDQSVALAAGNGSNPSPLGSADNATLAWAPDGSQIVYSSQFGDHWAQLFVMNSDGTVPVPLNAGPGSNDQPDWQPIP